MIFNVLSSLETVHDSVQYRYCIFSLLCLLLKIRLKPQNPLLPYVRERERENYTINVQCSVQYTLLLLYLCVLHKYHIIYSIRYYPQFHITAVGLGTYCLQVRGSACTLIMLLWWWLQKQSKHVGNLYVIKHILNSCICWFYYISLNIPLMHGYGTC